MSLISEYQATLKKRAVTSKVSGSTEEIAKRRAFIDELKKYIPALSYAEINQWIGLNGMKCVREIAREMEKGTREGRLHIKDKRKYFLKVCSNNRTKFKAVEQHPQQQ